MFPCAAVLLLALPPALLLRAAGAAGADWLVHAPAGSFRGAPAADGDYVEFLGIPYARVNSSNPFGASIPIEKFTEVFEATAESAVCPQMKEVYTSRDFPYAGSLDCLRLNVYVPGAGGAGGPGAGGAPRAVFVFVFGGRFNTGHSERSSYGPAYLVRHDIVVVTFNFRVGPYGFMCTDLPEVPGNQGLRDQYDAVRWVRDNIGAFGGDPGRVTLGGHSSGSMLVDMHLLSERPRLFQRAILQSGVATSPGFLRPPAPAALATVAGRLGFRTADPSAALSFLAGASPEAVIRSTEDEDEWGPCVEKKFEGVPQFISGNPELAEGANVDGLSVLGGFTDKECTYNLYSAVYSDVFARPDGFRRYVLDRKFTFPPDTNLVDIIRRFYLEDGEDRENYRYQLVDFLSDFNFVYPIQRQLIKYARHRNASVYQYLFSYDGGLNRMKALYNISEPGAVHSDELGYMFTMEFLPRAPRAADRRLVDRLTALWANFIKYGNPTPDAGPQPAGPQPAGPQPAGPLPAWPPLTADAVPCLRIDSDLTVISRPFRANIAFWDLFFDAHLDMLKVVPSSK